MNHCRLDEELSSSPLIISQIDNGGCWPAWCSGNIPLGCDLAERAGGVLGSIPGAGIPFFFRGREETDNRI